MVGPNACTRKRGYGVAQMGGGPTSGPGMLQFCGNFIDFRRWQRSKFSNIPRAGVPMGKSHHDLSSIGQSCDATRERQDTRKTGALNT